jgi:hypothetical protein
MTAGGGARVGNMAGVDTDGIPVGIRPNPIPTLSHRRQYPKVQHGWTAASKECVIAQECGTRGKCVSSNMRAVTAVVLILLLSTRLCAEERGLTSAVPSLSLDTLSATRDRPLFAPNRRKPAPSHTPATPSLSSIVSQQPQKPQLALMGIIVTGSETIVLLENTNTSEVATVRSGESVGPWQVVADSNYTVKLTDGKQEFTLQIFAEP